MSEDSDRYLQLAREVLEIERDALDALARGLDQRFARACELCRACQGRIVVTGMGKSGHVGGKIAATLASTGSPAFFVHPGEASHGDLGMITPEDLVIAISNSGETDEILTILPLIKRLGIPLIAMTGVAGSTLDREADVTLLVAVDKEACPLNLAPTASTTATLAMGDALAVALLESRGFTEQDFARSHPGGSLGRRLLLHVRDLMHTGEAVPRVSPDTSVADALMEITRKGLGFTAVVEGEALRGVYTDGDLRRTLDRGVDMRSTPISEVMTPGGRRIGADELAAEAVKMMEDGKITVLCVEDAQGHLVGALHMHDLLRARVI